MSSIRVGLLGAGYILKSHAKALQGVAGVTLQAVCDLSRGRAQAAAAEFGAPDVFGSIEELAASKCDAVHVLLPPALHIAAGRRLLEAGKHVLLEKPMGLSSHECAELTALADAKGLRLGVNHNFLFAPAYQPIRDGVRTGALGAIDTLTLNWLYTLPLLQFGPFNNWMVAAPGNLVFELGPHLAAFAVDLLGPVEIASSVAANPVDLPGDQRVYRRWTAVGQGERAGMVFNLSVAPGQTDRSLHLRTIGGVAHFDFEKGVAWTDEQSSDNPIIDSVRGARRAAGTIRTHATRDFGRYFLRMLRKQPAGNPFEESIFESIRTFYAGVAGGEMDPRLSGRFGTDVIRLCEGIVAAAKIDVPAAAPVAADLPQAAAAPRILVVGGTGFIGRRLVARLAKRGLGVRVLTRNVSAAKVDLAGLPVELMQGSHGDPATLDRALDGIDVVYHLAKAEGQRWQDYVDGDIKPTQALAEAAVRHKVRRFIYTGTIDSYASARAGDRITGDTPVDPRIVKRNLYARSKAACEALLKTLEREQGLPVVILRPGVVIGEGSPPAHLGVGKFVSNARVDYWGDGTNKVPFVLVDDVAAALERAFDAPGIDGATFLLTDAPLLSARDYVAAVEARAGGAVKAAAHPVWRYWLADLAKEGLKHLIRHPNRRTVTYHDWDCRSHRARYDSTETQERLGWHPAGTREALIEQGVNASVDRFMR